MAHTKNHEKPAESILVLKAKEVKKRAKKGAKAQAKEARKLEKKHEGMMKQAAK